MKGSQHYLYHRILVYPQSMA